MRKRIRQEEPFQMAPMIDMVFLLLVFFMTVSTMAKDARPELELPLSRTAEVVETAPPREVISLIPGKESVDRFWRNQKVDMESLAQLLQDQHQNFPDHEVVVRASPALPWDSLHEILQLCRESGIGDVIIATFED